MIYYIACTSTERLKIGYTRGEPEVRLKQLQTGSAADLRLIACHAGDPDDERSLHERFSDQRIRGEWFEMNEELFDHICWVVWFTGVWYSATANPAPQWVKAGLRMIQDTGGKPLPEDLAELVQ